jgi:uncharacterized ferritin-like protein (DUF455 family)
MLEFGKRYLLVNELEMTTYSIGLAICESQKYYGDFHLKTTLGFLASDLLFFSQYINRKKLLLDISTSQQKKRIFLSRPNRDLSYFLLELKNIIKNISLIYNNLRNRIDVDLKIELFKYLKIFKEYRTQLTNWIIEKPTSVDELSYKNGLYRDCFVFDYVIPTDKEIKYIRDSNLKDDFTRAIYLSANAYLEITSIDIISDLIFEANKQESYKYEEMTYDLARQLNDECKHSEILADRVIKMGFDIGIAPIHTQTWVIYKSLNLLSEKILAQQVLQEGVGLDSSAVNIMKMLEIGDPDTANVYTQITADEKNHVCLGMKWYHNLDERPMDKMIEKITTIVESYYVMPKVPIIPELRRKCGFTDIWIEKMIKENGKIDLTTINDYIYKKITNGQQGIGRLPVL